MGRRGPEDRREGHVRRRGPREDDRAVRARARGQARPGRIARVRRVRITLTNNEFGRDEERITNFLAASSEKRICSITSPEFFSTK